MNFIQLTSNVTGSKKYVNMELVCKIESSSAGGAELHFTNDEGSDCTRVKESPQKIMDLMEQ